MKVLLINPASSLINKSWAYRKFFTPIAPLGVAYVAATLKEDGVDVSICDQFAEKISNKDLLERIKRDRPQIVGFSALTPVMSDIRRLVLGIREVSGHSKIVMGNIHGTCFPEEVLKEGHADIIVRGEGEHTMRQLCDSLNKGSDLKDLPGISFRSNGQIVHNRDRELIEDLDLLPFPAWHLLDPDNYLEVPLAAIYKARAFPIIASRGCCYRCYYCSQDKMYNRVRIRDLNKVVDEMEYFNTRLNIKYFGFSDAYFPLDEKSGLEFCDLVIKRKLNKKLKWCTETRVDKVSARLLKVMKEAGAHLIMYGVEVGNAKVLESIHKGTTLEQAECALRQTRKAGIISQGLFMLGLPGETEATCRDTINFAKKLDCDIVKFNIAIPYPGSLFFEEHKMTEAIKEPEKFTSWFDWTGSTGELIFCPEGMESRTLRYLQRRAMLEFYVRPKVIFRHLCNRTISLRNIFYGGIWLISLFCSGFIAKTKKLFRINREIQH
ncbi:MAG: cobalamin-dependent protein [Candidatus Omnitrophica bacterium]|nr:cobalamin-dependent protein [Candidatus Omnitrophota bacterium]